jgi:hypothetical protein
MGVKLPFRLLPKNVFKKISAQAPDLSADPAMPKMENNLKTF